MKWWNQMPWSSFFECLSQVFHSSFTFIERLFSSSSLSAIRVVSSAYLRLLVFLLAALIWGSVVKNLPVTAEDAGDMIWGSVVKNLPANAEDAGDTGLIPGSGRSLGGGSGSPFQYSCLESSMDRVAWWVIVHGVTKTQTQLSDSACKKHSNSVLQLFYYFTNNVTFLRGKIWS